MTKAPEAGDVATYSSPQEQSIQDHGFDPNAAGKTKTAAQTIDSILCMRGHSHHSGFIIEASSSGGERVCSEESLTKSDSTASSSGSCFGASSRQQQGEELDDAVSCPYSNSIDNLINLPDDLIREVIRRLDRTDVVRLNSLNRSWRSEVPRILTDEGHIIVKSFYTSGHLAYVALRHLIYEKLNRHAHQERVARS